MAAAALGVELVDAASSAAAVADMMAEDEEDGPKALFAGTIVGSTELVTAVVWVVGSTSDAALVVDAALEPAGAADSETRVVPITDTAATVALEIAAVLEASSTDAVTDADVVVELVDDPEPAGAASFESVEGVTTTGSGSPVVVELRLMVPTFAPSLFGSNWLLGAADDTPSFEEVAGM